MLKLGVFFLIITALFGVFSVAENKKKRMSDEKKLADTLAKEEERRIAVLEKKHQALKARQDLMLSIISSDDKIIEHLSS